MLCRQGNRKVQNRIKVSEFSIPTPLKIMLKILMDLSLLFLEGKMIIMR